MKLGVNIDHVATLRQARGGFHPDPVEAASLCVRAGADSIVMHLREDRRHVQDCDLFRVKRELPVRLNLEMSIAPSVMKTALRLVPDQATLVPEKRMERTTEGGLDLFKKQATLHRSIGRLRQKGIEVSLFIDPNPKQLDEAARIGADAVEFHTGDYANAATPFRIKKELSRLRRAVDRASAIGMTAHAGHGLDYDNVTAVAKIKGLVELNIGYSIVTRALWVGLEEAVRQMRRLVR